MTHAPRPDPDALLRELKREEERSSRGRLKVFLGMAAGVGKTYAMLSEAQEQIGRGVDVVIGYVESHGRAETEALVDGLEPIPLRQIRRGSVTLAEFDLDAALARRPSILLLDELAHTNAEECRHPKRWMDVEELLQAGVNVYTCMNVQHLESLNDVVAKITGVVVRETVPDAFLEAADEIELVDLPPDELLQRLEEGKVYVPAQAEQAVRSFFRKGNLIALRELALRQTAQRVEAEMRSYRTTAAIRDVWAATHRIMVCVAPNDLGPQIVRTARRITAALHTDALCVFIDSPSQNLSPAQREKVRTALELAASLGMEVVTASAGDIVQEVLRIARQRNVTMILVGRPAKPRWRELLFGSVVDELVRHSGEIDVHVVTSSEPERASRPRIVDAPPGSPNSYLLALGVVLVASATCALADRYTSPVNLAMLYLAGIAVIAARTGFRETALGTLLSVGLFNFLFLEPRHTFAVFDPHYFGTFVIMLGVAAMISTLASRARLALAAANEREARTSELYGLSRELARARRKNEVADAVRTRLGRILACDVALLFSGDGSARQLGTSTSSALEKPEERAVAEWCVSHGQEAGKGTNTLPGSDGLYLPLRVERGTIGAVAVFTPKPLDAKAKELAQTFADQAAMALERTVLAKETHVANLANERERMRSSLLSSVSHDFRTPLTLIEGASTMLLADRPDDPAARRELLQSIHEEARRLGLLVRNLLDMTRIEAGPIEVQRDWVAVGEVLASALHRSQPALAGREVGLDLEPNLPLLRADPALLEQVLVNLLENAARHTPFGTPVDVRAWANSQTLAVEVQDRGPGLAPGEQQSVFEKFYRGHHATSGQGSGLGLAICKAIVEAHGGRIEGKNRFGGGATFTIELPLPDTRPHLAGEGDD